MAPSQGESSTSKAPQAPQTTSPPSQRTPMHSRKSSHVPANPSQLRESHVLSPTPSPEDPVSGDGENDGIARYDYEVGPLDNSRHEPEVEDDGIHPTIPDDASARLSNEDTSEQLPIMDVSRTPDLRTRLLSQRDWDASSCCGSVVCNHGTFSPRPGTQRSYGSFASDMARDVYGGRYPGGLEINGQPADATQGLLGGSGAGPGKKMSTTQSLARQYGVKNQRAMCVEQSFSNKDSQLCLGIALLVSDA